MKRYLVFGATKYEGSYGFEPMCHSDSFLEIREMIKITPEDSRRTGVQFGRNCWPYDHIQVVDTVEDKVYEWAYPNPNPTESDLNLEGPELYNK